MKLQAMLDYAVMLIRYLPQSPFLTWKAEGKIDEYWASLRRSDGLVLTIAEARGNEKRATPMLHVYFDFYRSIPGINREYVAKTLSNFEINVAVGEPMRMAQAIHNRLLGPAEQEFFKLRKEAADAKAKLDHQVQVLKDLGERIGNAPRGRDGAVERGEGYINYERGNFSLEIKYTGYRDSFHVEGYCNYIPRDLMYRLIPVIEEWWMDQAETAS